MGESDFVGCEIELIFSLPLQKGEGEGEVCLAECLRYV